MPAQRRPNTLRHPAADYSDPGAYFVTLCTRNREPLFGEVTNGEMKCNQFGALVWQTWKSLPVRYPAISIDAAIVMPDHFHGIIVIHDLNSRRGDSRIAPFGEVHPVPKNGQGRKDRVNRDNVGAIHDRATVGVIHELPLRQKRRIMTIPLVIGYLKMNTAKRINAMRGTSGNPVWQRNYFDKILRVDKDYDALVEYILTNPIRWGIDKD